MNSTVYKIIYNPSINPLLVNSMKLINGMVGSSMAIPPSGVFTFSLPDKETFKLKTNQTCWVTKIAFWEGVGNFEYSDLFIDLIKDIPVFLDIGSNIGYYSIIAGSVNPNAEVYAFEPATGPLHFLRDNVKLNKLEKKVHVVDTAISDCRGEVTFFEQRNPKYTYLKYNLGGMSGEIPDTQKNMFKPYQVKTITLDEFTKNNKIDGIGLIKMDTEGTEDKILKAASETIKKDRPIIICETLFNTIEDRLETIMKDHGYLFFNFKDGKLTKVKTIVRVKDDGVRDCFFVPREKEHMISKYL